MRRSGSSSSCLLQPRYGSTSSLTSLGGGGNGASSPSLSMDGGVPNPPPPPKNSQRIAVVTTTRLPPYSVERYYALSEIERHAHSVVFLDGGAAGTGGRAAAAMAANEGANDDDTHSTACSSLSGAGTGAGGRDDVAAAASAGVKDGGVGEVEVDRDEFPPYVVLYLLWRGDRDRGRRASEEDGDWFRSDVGDFVDVIEGAVSRVLGGRSGANEATGSSSSMADAGSSPLASNQGGGGGSYEIEGYCRQQVQGQRQESDADGRAAIRIHVVVDRVSPSPPPKPVTDPSEKEQGTRVADDEHDEHDDEKEHDDCGEVLHAAEARVVERLAKRVANSRALRSVVDGMTIGFTTEQRAAPALVEAVLSAVTLGARERRYLARQVEQHKSRYGGGGGGGGGAASPNASANANDLAHVGVAGNKMDTEGVGDATQRSLVGVVALRPDDLTGFDEHGETDAVQGIRQSLTRAEWNGCGDYASFAARANEEWKSRNDCSSYDVAREEGECLSTTMVVVFLVGVAAYCIHYYGDVALDFLQQLLSSMRTYDQ